MMAKPMKTLELHYPMIQFLISRDSFKHRSNMYSNLGPKKKIWQKKFEILRWGSYVACVASVSVEFGSKERPRNGVFGILPARKMGREPKKGRWG